MFQTKNVLRGISDIRDESDRDGVRVVIELKRDAVADVILNQLYRFTQVQTSFGINMLALNGGKPEQLSLKKSIRGFSLTSAKRSSHVERNLILIKLVTAPIL